MGRESGSRLPPGPFLSASRLYLVRASDECPRAVVSSSAIDPISKQTRTAFREHLVSTTLGYITDLFDSADVPRVTASSRISGARRGLVEEYYAGVDWTSLADLRNIINAYKQVLNRAQEFQSDPHYVKELKKLTALLHRDGYVFEGTRLIPLAGIDLTALEAAPTGVDRASLRDLIFEVEVI
jgi:hypothetical protein